MSIMKQATNKTLTGKLQRHLKKLTDQEKLIIFKQLKANLAELLVDQYGRYVIVLFLKSNIIPIVDTLISFFDRLIYDLMKNKNGYLFCQSIIENKFKDIRLRRVLKKIDQNLPELIDDPYASLIVLTYVNLLSSNDMEAFVEYCKTDFMICLTNQTACKIFAKVFLKVSDVERLEIELHLKNIMPQVFEGKGGRELVEVFLIKSDSQSVQPLLKTVHNRLEEYLKQEDFEYFFNKIAELKRTEIIDEMITKVFLEDGLTDKQLLSIINHESANKILLTFFTLSSLQSKDKLCHKLSSLRQLGSNEFTQVGRKLLNLCDFYFSSHPNTFQLLSDQRTT